MEFAAGSLLAWIAPQAGGVRPVIGWACIGGGIVWLAVAYSREVSTFAAHALPAVAMLAGALLLEPLARARIIPLGVFLGDASYSIYLAHPFGLRAWHITFERLVGTGSMAALTIYVLSALVVGLCVGIVSYLFVEKPILNAFKRPRRAPT